jgi:hypothetical protein
MVLERATLSRKELRGKRKPSMLILGSFDKLKQDLIPALFRIVTDHEIGDIDILPSPEAVDLKRLMRYTLISVACEIYRDNESSFRLLPESIQDRVTILSRPADLPSVAPEIKCACYCSEWKALPPRDEAQLFEHHTKSPLSLFRVKVEPDPVSFSRNSKSANARGVPCFTTFRETHDALTASQKKIEEIALQNTRMEALREFARLSKLRIDKGVAGYLEVLAAKNELFAAEPASVGSIAARYAQLINVDQAMGGGWVDVAGSIAAEPQGAVTVRAP